MVTPDPKLKAQKRTRGGRERLLQVAAQLFREKGFAGTSLQMIADRLGVSKAAIFHHFKSREEIIEALMAPVLAETEQAIATVRRLPKAERPHAAGLAFAEIAVTHRQISNLVYFDRFALRPELIDRVDALIDDLAALLARDRTAQEKARIRILIYGITGFVAELRQTDKSDASLRKLITPVIESFTASHSKP